MDIKSPLERSKNMARIKDKNTGPEFFIRSLLHRKGFRYRTNYKTITGKPDIYFTKKKVAIFIHGCYWHRHEGCKYSYSPKSHVEFWENKFRDNICRDNYVKKILASDNIRVLVIWECVIRKMCVDDDLCDEILKEILYFISQEDKMYHEISYIE
jgi:DNA mismatch endonuclease (patch repair protein)